MEDSPSGPSRVWNRIPDDIRAAILELVLEATELSPRELVGRFTDNHGYFVPEATAYRLLMAHDLITSPASIEVKAASESTGKTTRPNEMWQTNFTYFKIISWGCPGFGMMPRNMRRLRYLSIILDGYSRYIIARKLCSTMKAEDVTDTLDLAFAASG